jgi:presenilin-like A22 family membrane protease
MYSVTSSKEILPVSSALRRPRYGDGMITVMVIMMVVVVVIIMLMNFILPKHAEDLIHEGIHHFLCVCMCVCVCVCVFVCVLAWCRHSISMVLELLSNVYNYVEWYVWKRPSIVLACYQQGIKMVLDCCQNGVPAPGSHCHYPTLSSTRTCVYMHS